MISDIVSISLGHGSFIREEKDVDIDNIKDMKTRYYIRFMAQDHPGVLAKISKILASLNISIASVTQKERIKGKLVPIIMVTHEAKEDDIMKALARIDKIDVIRSPSQIIRIEAL